MRNSRLSEEQIILVLGALATLGGSAATGPVLAVFGLSLSLIAFALNVIGFD